MPTFTCCLLWHCPCRALSSAEGNTEDFAIERRQQEADVVRELGQVWATLPETGSARSSERRAQILLKKMQTYIQIVICQAFRMAKATPVLGWTDTRWTGKSSPILISALSPMVRPKQAGNLWVTDSSHPSEPLGKTSFFLSLHPRLPAGLCT